MAVELWVVSRTWQTKQTVSFVDYFVISLTKIVYFTVKIESIIEYEPGISNIAHELEYVRNNLYCRVILLYANALDAEIIFEEVKLQQMDQADYVWIVSEQVNL